MHKLCTGFLNDPFQRGSGHPNHASQSSLAQFSLLVLCIQCFESRRDCYLLSAFVHSVPLGNGDTFSLAFQCVGPLKFIDGGNHSQHKFAGRCAGVQVLFVADEVDALGL